MKSLDKFIVVFILIILGAVMFFSVRNDAPTSDEPPHILSGYVALKYGHDYIDTEHPLLIKTISASPLLLQNLKIDLKDPDYQVQKRGLDIGQMFKTSQRFMNYSGNNLDQILLSTRTMMIVSTLIFGLVLWWLAKTLFGKLVGVVSVFFYATEPNILAHGSLFNTDMGAAGFTALTIAALIFYNRKQNKSRLVFLILALTGAILTKFSTFYLVPIIGFFTLYINRKSLPTAFSHLAVLLIGSLGIISIFYGCIAFRDKGLVAFIPITYFQGLGMVFGSVSEDKRFAFLLGESYYGSRLYYFPILLLAKTQILTLVGFAISLILIGLKKLPVKRLDLSFTLVPIAIYFGLALIATFNIGVRHILPIYPLLIVFAAAGFVYLVQLLTKGFSTKIASIFLVSLLLIISLRGWSVTSTYPHFLGYYNFLFGSTDEGWKVANDSNYDWGQDVGRLAEFVRSNNIKSIAFDNYTGLYAARDYYKLPVQQIDPGDRNYKGYVALSTSVITFHQNRTKNYSWIVDNYKPIHRAGKSIFVYRID